MVGGVGAIGGLAAPPPPTSCGKVGCLRVAPSSPISTARSVALVEQTGLCCRLCIQSGGEEGEGRQFLLCTQHEKNFAATNAVDEFPLLSQSTQQPQLTTATAGRGGGQGVVSE